MGALETITRYYDGCTTGDVELMLGTLDPGVVHWFLAPNTGSAVIEWTMFWRPDGAPGRVATRGAEWFVLAADGRIAEIRSYYQQRAQTTELDGFPYATRGYSTAGVERSALHG
jgi:hypothetical protein